MNNDLNIYHKSSARIAQENRDKQYKAQQLKEKFEPTCEYYIMGANNQKIDVSQLSAIDVVIFSLNRGDLALMQYVTPNQKIKNYKDLRDIYNLKSLISKPHLMQLFNTLLQELDDKQLFKQVERNAKNNYMNLNLDDALKLTLSEWADAQGVKQEKH